MQLEYSAATSVGRKRKHNEDAYLIDADLGLYTVCDGMGGHAAGEVASKMTVDTVAESLRGVVPSLVAAEQAGEEFREAALTAIKSAVKLANRQVRHEATVNPERRGMGTTCTAMLVIGTHAFIGHVGDSRLYLLRGDQVHQVTTDHTLVNKMIRAGRLTIEEAPKVKYSNALTRAVGVHEDVEVETLELDILPDDLLLLCSDGLHNYFGRLDVKAFLSHLDVQAGSEELITFANRAGGKDNITAILMRAPGSDTDEARRIRLTLSTLREIPLFHYLSFAELLRVITVCHTFELGPGHAIVTEGTPGDELFVLLDGSAGVLVGGQHVADIAAGDHFGEMAMIDNHPRSATVETTSDSTVLRIVRDDFYALLRDDSVLAVKLLWNFIQSLSMMVRKNNVDVDAERPEHPYKTVQ